MERRWIDIDNIRIEDRLRKVDDAKVSEIAASIREIGLMNPPAVRFVDLTIDGEEWINVPVLITGHHRISALKLNGELAVECCVYDVGDDDARLMEIDENLKRAELTAGEEAAHVRQRQEIWERKNGPAKAIGARAANAVLGRGGQDANAKSAFASETATAAGKSLRAVQVAAQRGRELGQDITRVIGTSLDKGVELDALIKLPEPERAALIERAVAGEKVSARADETRSSSLAGDEVQQFIRKLNMAFMPTFCCHMSLLIEKLEKAELRDFGHIADDFVEMRSILSRRSVSANSDLEWINLAEKLGESLAWNTVFQAGLELNDKRRAAA